MPNKQRQGRHGEEGLAPTRITNLTAIRQVKNKLTEDGEAVVAELKKILAEAEAGKVNGLIYIISRIEPEGHEYVDGAAGVYTRFPTDAVGQLEVVKLKFTRLALDGPR